MTKSSLLPSGGTTLALAPSCYMISIEIIFHSSMDPLNVLLKSNNSTAVRSFCFTSIILLGALDFASLSGEGRWHVVSGSVSSGCNTDVGYLLIFYILIFLLLYNRAAAVSSGVGSSLVPIHFGLIVFISCRTVGEFIVTATKCSCGRR